MSIDALKQSLTDGTEMLEEISVLSERLARLMQQIHGGSWRIGINHDSCFVSIARDFRDGRGAKRC